MANKIKICFSTFMSWFFKIVGVIAILFIVIVMIVAIGNKQNTSPMTDEQRQERYYNECLETVYQSSGNKKKTLTSGDPTTEERLYMKKYCLCISDIKASRELLEKKTSNFIKKNNGMEPSGAERDVINVEVEAERNKICNKQG